MQRIMMNTEIIMMNTERQHIDIIREQFASLQSKDDLLTLLNVAKEILYGKKAKAITLKSLTHYANPAFCLQRYQTFSIRKKTGGERVIQAPVQPLRSILRPLNFILQCVFEPHAAANGFVWDKSVVDNARLHVGNRYVYNLDLKDFFHSFDRNRVKLGFMRKPFALSGEREELAFFLACLCTHPLEIDGDQKTVLPQGAPTSPTITNILCHRLDRRLTGLAHRFGAKYSRYADDITFSSPHHIYKNPEFLGELQRLIREDNLITKQGQSHAMGPQLMINERKTRLQKNVYRQEVTGLIVNEKVNVSRKYYGQIRMWIYYWEKYGYEKAQEIFIKDYSKNKSMKENKTPEMSAVLEGKLEFMKMVRGEKDQRVQGLVKRLNSLQASIDPVHKIIDIWETEGIEEAMKAFNGKTSQPDLEKFISNFKYQPHFEEFQELTLGDYGIDETDIAEIDELMKNCELTQEDYGIDETDFAEIDELMKNCELTQEEYGIDETDIAEIDELMKNCELTQEEYGIDETDFAEIDELMKNCELTQEEYGIDETDIAEIDELMKKGPDGEISGGIKILCSL